jgi:hypothetical protein
MRCSATLAKAEVGVERSGIVVDRIEDDHTRPELGPAPDAAPK